jgi:asparagine synthase (glutamine-hydrolysing)
MRQRGNDTRFFLSPDSRLLRIQALKRGRSRRPDLVNALRGIHGLDSLMPLADLRLVEFCLAIPEEQFLENGTNRYLARRLLRAAGVPRAVTENKLRGRQHPEWFAHLSEARSSLPALMERLRRSPTAQRLLDLDRLDPMIGNWPADTVAAERQRSGFSALLSGALSVGAFIAWAEGTN